MKKSVVIITVVFMLIALSCVCANAEEGEMIYDMSNVFDSAVRRYKAKPSEYGR